MAERIRLTVNGQAMDAMPDTTVAAAVMQATNGATRQSVTGAPRGPLCGMGVCFECCVTIDNAAHQRSCQLFCQPNTCIETNPIRPRPSASEAPAPRWRSASDLVKECDILVLGAGPAGIAAASCAAEVGKRVILLDDNPHAGGQIWRHDTAKAPAKQAATWIERLQRVRVEILPATQVIAAPTPTTLLAESPGGLTRIHAERIILACGARERFLPFPGWTLPGVFGAGGLQALVKSGYPIAKRRVVVAGSGPLLLAVAAYLRARGADVRLIAEQTPRSLLRFGASLLWNQPGKFGEALGLAWQLRGIPYRTAWPIRAGGAAHLESVTLTDGVKTWTEPCDALACGFGLAPNLELARLLGCDATRDFVLVDAEQQTSIRGIFAVGEMTGVGGLDKALIEGQIAGFCAADRFDRAQPLFHAREKARRFAALLDDTFSLREDLRQLPDDDTIVCRCEDVTFGRLKKHASWRDAKLQTRCGMGPCQGRICGPALQFLFGWTSDSVRPPILPTALANLAALADS